MKVVFDTNVLVSAFDKEDLFHSECRSPFETVLAGGLDVVAPILVLIETVCALRRRTDDLEASQEALDSLKQSKDFTWIFLDNERVDRVCRFGIQTGLKGADAIVAETARGLGLPLVTQDQEIHSKCADSLEVIRPSELVHEP